MTGNDGDRAIERELVALEVEECRALLRLESIGRLATCTAPTDSPDVVPVNYVVDGETVLFRTHDGATLDHVIGKPVSLQIDRFDWFHRSGWSVLLQGTAALARPHDGAASHLDSWAPGEQPRVVRIVPTRLSGRRIEIHQRPLDAEGYL